MLGGSRRPLPQLAAYSIRDAEHGNQLIVSGDWTSSSLDAVSRLIGEAPKPIASDLDISELGRIDSAGAYVLVRALGGSEMLRSAGREDLRRLADLIGPAIEQHTYRRPRGQFLIDLFARIGKAVATIGEEAVSAMDFFGRMVVALGQTIVHPRRLRPIPLVATMEEAGINAMPIVFTMTFFVGAIIALVGANLLTTLGVSVFTVQLVGVAILREFGVVIAAILLAGRSASAFAAQIGSMRMNQETDAMQVMGVDRFDALVVPRVLASVLMMPIMTFCADIGGIAGGVLVSWATMDINPVFFLQRMLDTVSISHFWIGMSKAPFLAMVISAAGCRHGLAAGRDTESLGRRVTSAVVQSIFMIIMFDAVFAVMFMVLDL